MLSHLLAYHYADDKGVILSKDLGQVLFPVSATYIEHVFFSYLYLHNLLYLLPKEKKKIEVKKT